MSLVATSEISFSAFSLLTLFCAYYLQKKVANGLDEWGDVLDAPHNNANTSPINSNLSTVQHSKKLYHLYYIIFISLMQQICAKK